MKAFQCDLCEKLQTGDSSKINVRFRDYEICENCLAKINKLISQIEKAVSKEK